MRILWLKVGGLWPLNTGGRQRTFHTLKQLSQRHSITLLTTHGPSDDVPGLAEQLSDCEEVVSLPHAPPKWGSSGFVRALAGSWMSGLPVDLYKWRAPGVRRQLADRLETGRFDVLLVDFLNAFGNVPSSATVPIVLFEHNVEYQIWKRLSRIETKWLRRVGLGAEWRRVRSWEAHACRIADLTIAVSERDRDELQQLAPGATIAAVPTGVDTDYFRPGERAEIPNRIAFSGSMDWYPNEDAMFFFVREVLPRVREAIPDASLVIVGRNPSQGVRKLEELPGVIVTGTVADVRPAIEEAALVVVPLRAGGGTRLKIFEALAMGKAVLSTSVGAEGLGVIAGCHLAVSDGAEALTRDVIELLKNPLRRRELGAAGRLLVESQYSWPTVAAGFERHLRSVRSARTLQPKQVRGST